MILNPSGAMVITTLDSKTFEVAVTDPVELDPAGITVEFRGAGERIFFSWTYVAMVQQKI